LIERFNYVKMMLDSIICQIVIDGQILEGDLAIPTGAKAIVLFAHGSGSSRHSTRNQYIAEVLNKAGFATLLVDLLSSEEKQADIASRHLRYNIELLVGRFEEVTKWLLQQPQTRNLKIGYFGSSTGAAAAASAAANFSNSNNIVKALVLLSGRLDLAEGQLSKIVAPTLLIVGSSDDATTIGINKTALKELKNAKDRGLALIPGTGHLFEEPGKMEEVAKIAAEWFEVYLLCSRKKFENEYAQKKRSSWLLSSIFRDKPRIQIKFKDRVAAGEILAALLGKYKKEEKDDTSNSITVIGIPRGGVVVADTVAKKLSIPDFDIVISRKLRAPNNSENAIGAIIQDGSVYLENALLESMNISNQYLETEKSEQKKEIDRRMGLYRPETDKEYNIKGRTVILIDDGAATGATLIAAAVWIRKQNPQRLIIALPVAPSQVRRALRQEANELEIIYAASNFTSVGQFYQNFDVVSDQEIIKLLEEYRKAAA
jgi:predicted phosphoribosyltransferase/dienelactone hydrolase